MTIRPIFSPRARLKDCWPSRVGSGTDGGPNSSACSWADLPVRDSLLRGWRTGPLEGTVASIAALAGAADGSRASMRAAIAGRIIRRLERRLTTAAGIASGFRGGLYGFRLLISPKRRFGHRAALRMEISVRGFASMRMYRATFSSVCFSGFEGRMSAPAARNRRGVEARAAAFGAASERAINIHDQAVRIGKQERPNSPSRGSLREPLGRLQIDSAPRVQPSGSRRSPLPRACEETRK